MVSIEKKLRLLEIDTKSIPSNLPLSTCTEEDNNDNIVTDSPIPITTVRQRRLTTTSNQRHSTSFLNHPINIHNEHQEEQEVIPAQDLQAKGHKRSTSAGNESFWLPRSHSALDFNIIKKDLSDTKKSPCNSNLKKRWFQLPRMTLIRQSSTPPREKFGGLKAGLVEPPEPPPQLLFNLDWSSKNSPVPLLWDNDVSAHSLNSDSAPPSIHRRSSGYGFDIIVSNNNNSTVSDTNIPIEKPNITRRLSCPFYDNSSLEATTSSSTAAASSSSDSTPQSTPPLTPNEIISHHKLKSAIHSNSKLFSNFQRPNLRRKTSSDVSGITPSASSSTSSTSSSSSTVSTPSSSPMVGHADYFKPIMFNIYLPNSGELVLDFSKIRPRINKLKRKTSLKAEQKALQAWQTQLLLALDKMKSVSTQPHVISPEKKARYFLTRKFILREFYTTEINYWNQLNYTKVMFADPLQLAVDRHSDVVRPNDLDWFANLKDLMKFSSNLILRLRNAHVERSTETGVICQDSEFDPGCKTCPNDVKVGLVLRESAEQMVTFLNCALDYRANRKLLDSRKHNKSYSLYNEKLALRKETRQFDLYDFLIIPIQRITRYGLLLADLEKHTESTHPDYEDIKIARCIVHSLAAAMNSVQKKS